MPIPNDPDLRDGAWHGATEMFFFPRVSAQRIGRKRKWEYAEVDIDLRNLGWYWGIASAYGFRGPVLRAKLNQNGILNLTVRRSWCPVCQGPTPSPIYRCACLNHSVEVR